ncbi:AAA family ATPase [Propioniciclava tarda]|uniref:ATP-binding protein n=1 Tax=Propioniciclava tarda TaxID=433330 RepID=A0A4Q9KNH7_PROTD|nr:ATP-binding protein [Propioniciclava tarda]TBT95359.1 ATP-binding protein [Propioniciclava tarda]SMO61446.1 ATPase family associated with various cellular activities (AAA) [Propioniciclava tarda]
MNPLVAWVAELLLASWRRQEREGRYRGADDFRALHIDPADALASWRAATAPGAPWPDGLASGFDAAVRFPDALGLDAGETLVAALAVAVEVEPRLRPLVAALTDDPGARQPTVGLAAELADALDLPPAAVRAAVAPGGRLALFGLVATLAVPGRPSPADAWVVASGWLTDAVEGEESEANGLAWVTAEAADGVRTTVVSGADHLRHAESVAAPSGRAALWTNPRGETLPAAARAALLADAVLVAALDDVPPPELVAALSAVAEAGVRVAVSLAPGVSWVAPASWRVLTVSPAPAASRARRWADALARRGAVAHAEDLAALASEYPLGLDAIEEAAERAVAGWPADDPQVPTLGDLRLAARRTAWRDLSSCARPGPTGSGWDDLVVTDAIGGQLRDVAAAIGQRGRVLDDWGFGGRPGSRGYHVLFAGPSGTGKTMSAGVIAAATGLELWVVDLARVVDKYLGETEKAIDKVLRAAEASGAMLLFDEADALFGRRGEVKEAKDRWANVEVAFLLQRIEEHDGVTVLTTNVSHHLDEAFARRMSQRVEFTVPDASLRRRLWTASLPADAPLDARSDLETVADRFELAGGAIRTAALNAAYEAAAEGTPIGLRHLVRASVLELAKSGRPPTRADLGDLGVHLGAGR